MPTTAEKRRQPGYWAEYLLLWDEPITEGLQLASCAPACKAISTCAAGAWERGWTADKWRQDVMGKHPEADELRLIAEAEDCMRKSGLWLWND